MTSEAALRAIVRRALAPYGIIKRVENPIDPGTPDMAWQLATPRLGSAAGWLELKALEAFPSRQATPVRIPSLTREQAAWAAEWEGAGGKSPLLLQVGRAYGLFAGARIGELFLDNPHPAAALAASASVWAMGRFPTALILRALIE